ncbi:metal ABC transporter permease [Elusimicrobiota bacterium]
MIEILQYPFMQRALLAGLMLGGLLAFLGVFVVLRKMSFFASGIAHASLAGVAVGIIASINPLLTAVLFSIVFSVIIYFIEKKYNIASDATIGIIFSSGMALGVLLMSLKPGYQPELMSFLFGNILAIRQSEIWLIYGLGAVIFGFLFVNLKKITLLSLDIETAYVSGIKVDRLQLLIYIILAVVIVLGIKVLGIILVSALLVIPVATAKIFAGSFKKLIIHSIILSELIVIAGMFISYYLDIPTGPAIVLLGTVVFAAAGLYSAVKN